MPSNGRESRSRRRETLTPTVRQRSSLRSTRRGQVCELHSTDRVTRRSRDHSRRSRRTRSRNRSRNRNIGKGLHRPRSRSRRRSRSTSPAPRQSQGCSPMRVPRSPQHNRGACFTPEAGSGPSRSVPSPNRNTNEGKLPTRRENLIRSGGSFTTSDKQKILSVNNFKQTNFHNNVVPTFDPSLPGHRIDLWVNKVIECALIYGWDDRQIIHFALQKLAGNAKIWYDSLPSIMFTWKEWQLKLFSAFPFEQN